MEIPIHIGIPNDSPRVTVIWPDSTFQEVDWKAGSVQKITYVKDGPQFPFVLYRMPYHPILVSDITDDINLRHLHTENPFLEFNREPLIPHMVSREGPALAVADINHDGFEDVFIGGSKGNRGAIWIQNSKGKFSHQPESFRMEPDSMYEDVDACWVDVNNDKHLDLVVASGGNEYYGEDRHLNSRVYLNDGKGSLKRLPNAIDKIYMTASCVVPYDFTGDGYVDLFIGGRAVPWEYGEIPKSYLLANDKTGKFKEVTTDYSKGLSNAGFVKNAIWVDIDNDKDLDLILSLEWGGIDAYINNNGKLDKKALTNRKGWWNFTLPFDIDDDGDLDLIAGNLGLNNRLKASEQEPVRLYYYDFDGNGKKDQVLTYYLKGKEIPFANKDELTKQIPALKKKFLYAEDFAKASLKEIFDSEKLNKAEVLSADYFSNAVLINNGNLEFTLQALPWEAQLTSYRDATLGDEWVEILLIGNFYDNNIQMGRYDADYGTSLNFYDKGKISANLLLGSLPDGQIRKARPILIGKRKAIILGLNNDSTKVIEFKYVPHQIVN